MNIDSRAFLGQGQLVIDQLGTINAGKSPMQRARIICFPLIWFALLLSLTSDVRAAGDSKTHWAFLPVAKPNVSGATNSNWARTSIDIFIASKLQERAWQPAPDASKSVLIRRLYFDLTGLPPAPEQIQQFVSDDSPGAYEALVDQLLSSRQYGEHSAQSWLDLVRYAETEGYEYDRHIPDAWRYRDYVIESLNADKPYNRFLLEQIAGDEVEPANRECQTASIFHRLGPVRRNAGNPEIALSRNEVLTERTDIIGSAFLGLTIGCARCHNHKLEPILQKDYYQLQAYFAATDEHNINLASSDDQKAWETRSKDLTENLKKLRQDIKTAEGERRMKLTQQAEDLEDQLPAPLPTIPATWNDFQKRTEIHVLKRGVWGK